jgi:hypothetical protein
MYKTVQQQDNNRIYTAKLDVKELKTCPLI